MRRLSARQFVKVLTRVPKHHPTRVGHTKGAIYGARAIDVRVGE